MQRYLNNSIVYDIVISFTVTLVSYFILSSIWSELLEYNHTGFINSFEVALITVGSTLIGFLLTIITVIVTFKKGFEDSNKQKSANLDAVENLSVFDKKPTNETKFYGTNIHKYVVNVFIDAAYEIFGVVFFLLLLQFRIFLIHELYGLLVNIFCFVIVLLAVARSLYVFKHFLNVHLPLNE